MNTSKKYVGRLFLLGFVVFLLSSCAAYFTADTAAYRGRVGATMPQDSLIFKNK